MTFPGSLLITCDPGYVLPDNAPAASLLAKPAWPARAVHAKAAKQETHLDNDRWSKAANLTRLRASRMMVNMGIKSKPMLNVTHFMSEKKTVRNSEISLLNGAHV